MKNKRIDLAKPIQRWLVLILIYILAFVPRALYPVSRPMQWFNRSIRFVDALLAADWEGTYQRSHPGVTTMWLSGIGIKLFAFQTEQSSQQLLGTDPTKPGVIDRAVTAGVIPLALAIALCISGSYPLISNILGRKTGFVASVLMSLDPFFITYSKVLHVDALLAAFMLLSALFLLNYFKREKASDLIHFSLLNRTIALILPTRDISRPLQSDRFFYSHPTEYYPVILQPDTVRVESRDTGHGLWIIHPGRQLIQTCW